MDPRKYNGAVFLGLNGIAVKVMEAQTLLVLQMQLVLLLIWLDITLYLI